MANHPVFLATDSPAFSSPWRRTGEGDFLAGCPAGTAPAPEDVAAFPEWLLTQRVHFGCVQMGRDRWIAATDRTRSYPVFYVVDAAGELHLADHPAKLMPFCAAGAAGHGVDDEALAIYLESGYCVDDQTFLRAVRQLRPAEFLVWDVTARALTISSYYHFIPRFPEADPGRDYQVELGEVLDRAIDRVIAQAAGREIWVPLSGGLDSRAVLCKLHERGYPKIQTFSWGPPGNTEAETAEYVARVLGVPWQLIPPDSEQEQRLFSSPEFSDFLRWGGALSFAPTLNDFFTLARLHEKGCIGPHSVIVNGQSGDYITGGHFPVVSGADPEAETREAFLKKHFHLWQSFRPDVLGLAAGFVERSRAVFTGLSRDVVRREPHLAFYGWLEWRERQSKYVVACQRTYDYFGTDWALPLWDSDLMDFYQDVPLALQVDQKLYIDYLQSWNYRGVFSFIRRPVNPWPRHRFLIVSIARVIGVLLGRERKRLFYRYMAYWGSHGNYYHLFRRSVWRQVFDDVQNHESVYAVLQAVTCGVDLSGLERKFPRIARVLALFKGGRG